MPRKKRSPSRKSRRAPSRGFILGIVVVLTGVAVLVARTRAPMTSHPIPPASATEEETAKPIVIDSDWDRFRLRMQSEYLRTIGASDRAALLRLTSRTLRGSLEAIGIDRARIEERGAGALLSKGRKNAPAAAEADAHAPIQWHIQAPRRASLFRINDALTQGMEVLGGNVIRGVERPAPLAGVLLDLTLGYGRQPTHKIIVEPSEAVADRGAQLALIVTDLDRKSASLYRAFLRSPVPFSLALRPDKPEVVSIGREMRGAGHETLLQLPMEPKGYPRVDPGKDAILLDLSRIEIEDRIARCLTAVGPVQGVVSRLGGAALNDPDVMRAVLDEVKRRDLPFIDAHGSGATVVDEIGEETGAQTLVVGAALDGNYFGSATGVRTRLKELIQSAVQHGSLIVTMTPSPLVLSVLEEDLPKLKAQGVEIVPVSKLAL